MKTVSAPHTIAKLMRNHKTTAMTMQSPEKQALTLALESKSDPSSAAQSFTKSTNEAFLAGAEIEAELERSWDAVLNVAAHTSHGSQEPLVDVLRAVQKENVSQKNGKKCVIWGEESNLWQDLPMFGVSAREAWNKVPATGSSYEFSPEEWTNLNAFMARVTALSAEVPAFDFSLYAIWTMRTAFEGNRKGSDSDVGAAKAWFSYAKDIIEKLSKEEKSFDGKIARGGEKYEDKGWRGFNVERLEIWRAGLQ